MGSPIPLSSRGGHVRRAVLSTLVALFVATALPVFVANAVHAQATYGTETYSAEGEDSTAKAPNTGFQLVQAAADKPLLFRGSVEATVAGVAVVFWAIMKRKQEN